jgi:DNA-binding Lrp family transcriptional regulator
MLAGLPTAVSGLVSRLCIVHSCRTPDRAADRRWAVLGDERTLDALDVALLDALRRNPRAGALELSRTVGVARATVTARVQRLEEAGVITGYGPDVDVAAAGFGVQAFVTLEIAQGAIDDVRRELEAIPGVLEAHATTGSGDVLCRVAARSHEALQQTLVDLNRSATVVRSTSVVALSQIVPWRTLPLLASGAAPGAGRSAMSRREGPSGPR